MRSRSVISSHLAEVFFNFAKNHKLVKSKKKFRRPEKSFAASLSRRVVSTVHKYDSIPLEACAEGCARKLAPKCFKAVPKEATLPINDIVSIVQKT
eukprot:4255717-Lingulodinium_polyedra.AAC.1